MTTGQHNEWAERARNAKVSALVCTLESRRIDVDDVAEMPAGVRRAVECVAQVKPCSDTTWDLVIQTMRIRAERGATPPPFVDADLDEPAPDPFAKFPGANTTSNTRVTIEPRP